MIRISSLGFVCALGLAILPSVHGQMMTFTVNPNAADSQLNSNGAVPTPTVVVGNQADFQSRVGEFFAPGGACYVAPFLIPTLPTGQVFTAASLRIQLFGLVGTPANADLYAVRVNASAQPVAGDYYQGLLDTSRVLLQQNFLTPASPVRADANTGPFITTNAIGSTALAAYLNSVDVNNSAAGQYLFLRINYDANPIPAGDNAYAVLTADAGGANEKPLLTLTSGVATGVPEPSTFVFLALAGVGVVAFRRRAQRS